MMDKIDGQDFVRGAVRRALGPAGHDVLEASDGAMGLQLLADHGADLVITDILMPGRMASSRCVAFGGSSPP